MAEQTIIIFNSDLISAAANSQTTRSAFSTTEVADNIDRKIMKSTIVHNSWYIYTCTISENGEL